MHSTVGKDVVAQEINALNQLHNAFPTQFDHAVHALAAAKGKVILTGIGKSAYVARKIAATMTSCGTPAVFMHATESMHGDLGMVQPNDVVIALSLSGTTKEVLDCIHYSKADTTIAITAQTNSPLAQAATIVLDIPNAPEACPLGVAPSTSTTLMMVLGDALAFALSTHKQWSEEQFASCHPGGALGKKLATMHQIMTPSIPTVHIHDTIEHIVTTMIQGKKGFVVVNDDHNSVVGALYPHHIPDLLRHQSPSHLACRQSVMTVNANDTMHTTKQRIKDHSCPVTVVLVENDVHALCGFWYNDKA